MRRVACAFVLCVGAGVISPARAPAQAAQDPEGHGSILDGYLSLLAQKKLAGPTAENIEELTELVQRAQEATLAGRHDEATAMLLEAVEGPRFRLFEDLDEFHAAELLLVSGLIEQRSLASAQRILDRMLARGPDRAAFGPAYRKAVDVALARGNFEGSAEHLAQLVQGALPEDAANELLYLRARAAYAKGDHATARRHLTEMTQRSRFYVSGQYLLGAMAAKDRDFREAEARFCKIATAGKDGSFSFYVDGRFFPVRDMAHLGLGRVAHETGRADDAFYYYFQIPHDSERLAEALFEAAWASYEGGDHDAALDSLDQLEARFPRSVFAAEAAVLSGHVHLARCEFGAAERELVKFEQRFSAVLREIDRTLASPARKQRVYRDLVARAESLERARARGDALVPDPDGVLLSLLAADPDFYRLHAQIRALDAELSRTGNVPHALAALAQRVAGRDAPTAELDEASSDARLTQLGIQIEDGQVALLALDEELRTLSGAKAPRAEVKALEAVRRELESRLSSLQTQHRRLANRAETAASAPRADELSARFLEDQAYVRDLQRTALRLRERLEDAADAAGVRALEELRARLARELRRARIGRIDAVMGSKRQVELQIESLAAGRFPPELIDPLRMQSLLRDDEEYWPFEGEDWPDEFVERYSREKGR